MKRAKITISGDVQGVFFRYFAKQEADKLGLKGWCRNESDGSVFVVIEGDEKPVERFIRWAKQGSDLATVEEVTVAFEKYTGREVGFEIR